MLCFERSRESKLEHSNDRYIHFIKYMIIYNKGCKPTKISWVFSQVMNIYPYKLLLKVFDLKRVKLHCVMKYQTACVNMQMLGLILLKLNSHSQFNFLSTLVDVILSRNMYVYIRVLCGTCLWHL